MFAALKGEIEYVSLLRSEDNLCELVFYKHFVPTERGAVPNGDTVTNLGRKTSS